MRGPHNIWRLIQTGATFERSGAMTVAMDAMDAPKSIRIPVRFLIWPFKFIGLKGEKKFSPMLRALIALGPAYIKFGQLLSTRPDVVGEGLATELRILQDALPAFNQKDSIKAIEKDLNINIDEIFHNFEKPVAAASLAQVHKATLKSNKKEVAVKVLRPGIEKAFLRDIDAFYFIARFIELLSPSSRRLKPLEVIKYFEGIVRAEIDLRLESAAAAEFHSNTSNDKKFRVPKVVWELSSKRVMTTEWVEGIPVGNIDLLRSHNINLKKLSELIIQSFLNNALRDGFFHADMHQGNLRCGVDGELIVLDFGIMGRIDLYTRRVYAQILNGFINKKYRKVAEVHFEAGYISYDQDIDKFAQALRSVGEPIFGMEASKISIAKLLGHLFEVTERFGMQVRTELLLLQRTMVVVEGVGRSLDPNLNMWEVARPVVESYIKENLGPKAIIRDISESAKAIIKFGPHAPYLIEKSLRNALDFKPTKPPKRRLPALIGGIFLGLFLGIISVLVLFLWFN
mgnify:FL=1